MKNIFTSILLLAVVCSSCSTITVEVENKNKIQRDNETIEISWKEIEAKLSKATSENIVVKNSAGKQVPSQVTADALIFQVTMKPHSTEKFTVSTGEREAYKSEVFARLVPKSMDDWAWENNHVAFRVYGPARAASGEVSNGIDAWAKNTSDLIIDKWYKPGVDFTKNNGEGLDFYTVGRTLGAGAMAPVHADTLCLGGNFTKAELIDNGPIRVSFRLHYAPFKVDKATVTEKRVISLDANTNFNRITQTYTGDFETLNAVAGVILREPKDKNAKEKFAGKSQYFSNGFTYSEPETKDGKMLLALLMPKDVDIKVIQNHMTVPATIENGKPVTYIMGAGWSQGGFSQTFSWETAVEQEIIRQNNPLVVTIK